MEATSCSLTIGMKIGLNNSRGKEKLNVISLIEMRGHRQWELKSKRKFNKGNVISSSVWQTLKEMTPPPKEKGWGYLERLIIQGKLRICPEWASYDGKECQGWGTDDTPWYTSPGSTSSALQLSLLLYIFNIDSDGQPGLYPCPIHVIVQ